ncbi:MAG: NfeD family protein [Pontixanthobacter sp.]
MFDFLDGIDAGWLWIAAGLALGTLELMVPGVYLIWLAVAALITGALTFVLDLGVAVSVVNFVFLSLIAVYSAKRFLRDRPIVSADPTLNNMGGRLMGETVVVTQAIDGGEGRVKLGDSEWIARGPDTPIGVRMRVAGIKGPILTVEPIAAEALLESTPPERQSEKPA